MRAGASGVATRRSLPGRSGLPGWASGLGRSTRFAVLDRRAVPVALLGFLARGGIVLILLPSAVLPSVLEIAGMTGLRTFTIAGDIHFTPWLIGAAVAITMAILAWLLLALIVGSLADAWLVAMTLHPAPPDEAARLPLPDRRAVARLAAIRALCLVPIVAALTLASLRLYDATYLELTSPSNLSTPLVLRVIQGAADAVAVVVAVWLACETLAAVAVRRQILLGHGVWRSLAAGAVQIVRKPISTLVTVAVTYAGSAVAMLATMTLTAAAFDWCRSAARAGEPIAVRLGIGDLATTRDFRPLAFAAAGVALALAWAIALAVSGAASVWRSAAMTEEVAGAIQETDRGL